MKASRKSILAICLVPLFLLLMLYQNFDSTVSFGADFNKDISGELIPFPTSFKKTLYVDCDRGESALILDGAKADYGLAASVAVGTLLEATSMVAAKDITRILLKKGSVCAGTLNLSGAKFESITVDAYNNPLNGAAFLPEISGKVLHSSGWIEEPALSSAGKTAYSTNVTQDVVYQMSVNNSLKLVGNILDSCNSTSSSDPMVLDYGKSSGTLSDNSPYDLVKIPSTDKLFTLPQPEGAAIFLRDGSWVWTKFGIASIDQSRNEIKIAIGPSARLSLPSFHYGYRIVNSAAVLDCPGEWIFNTQRKKIYYINDLGLAAPGTDSRPVHLTVEKHGIKADFQGKPLTNVFLRNIRIRHTGEAGIKINYVGNVILDNVHVENSNGYGVDIYIARKVAIIRSTIRNSNRTGVNIIGGVNSDFQFEKNRITNSGKLDQQTAGYADLMSGLNLWAGRSILIKNNIIESSAFAGINMKLSNSSTVIESNTIDGSCNLTNDCAGIYFNGFGQNDFRGKNNSDTWLGTQGLPRIGIGTFDVTRAENICASPPATKSLLIQYNLVNRSVGNIKGLPATSTPKILAGGIYLDWAASNADIFRNKIVNVRHMRGGIHLHGGRNIKIQENIVDQTVSGYPAISVAQLWNFESKPIATCHNEIIGNQFLKSTSDHYLVQLRRNNYPGGSNNFDSLAGFQQNTMNDEGRSLTVRRYEFRPWLDNNNDSVYEFNEPTVDFLNVE